MITISAPWTLALVLESVLIATCVILLAYDAMAGTRRGAPSFFTSLAILGALAIVAVWAHLAWLLWTAIALEVVLIVWRLARGRKAGA